MPAKSSIGGTAVQLTSTSTPLTYGVQIVAAAANSGKVYIGLANTVTAGGTSDTTDGFELSAGASIFLPKVYVLDASDVWLIGSAAGQAVYFLPL